MTFDGALGGPTVDRSAWVPDNSSDTCENVTCRKRFTLFRRRHHCRRCGHLFCSDCLKMRDYMEIDATHGAKTKQELCCERCSRPSISRRHLGDDVAVTQNETALRLLEENLDGESEKLVGFTIRPKLKTGGPCRSLQRERRRASSVPPESNGSLDSVPSVNERCIASTNDVLYRLQRSNAVATGQPVILLTQPTTEQLEDAALKVVSHSEPPGNLIAL